MIERIAAVNAATAGSRPASISGTVLDTEYSDATSPAERGVSKIARSWIRPLKCCAAV